MAVKVLRLIGIFESQGFLCAMYSCNSRNSYRINLLVSVKVAYKCHFVDILDTIYLMLCSSS
jgi:hypothetical protein